MDRQIVYPGSIPLDTDLLSVQRSIMVAIGYLAQATIGFGVVDGLGCVPAPAGLGIEIGTGSIAALSVIDQSAFGSLPAVPALPLVKMGVATSATLFPLTAPATPGQSIAYLVEAAIFEGDALPLVLPYYSAANPAVPMSGPGGAGAAQPTVRQQRVQLQLKAGAPANSGTQAVPATDAGWVPLYVVTINAGATSVSPSAIAVASGAPFVGNKIPAINAEMSAISADLADVNAFLAGFPRGHTSLAEFNGTSSWTAPYSGVVKFRLWGGGGCGGDGNQGAGGGGSGGGYTEGYASVVAGTSYPITVGVGAGLASQAGGTSSFGSFASATGGGSGGDGGSGYGGAGSSASGSGYGGALRISGAPGLPGSYTQYTQAGGAGGCSPLSTGGGQSVAISVGSLNGAPGAAPGGAGAGGVLNGTGGGGSGGLVILEF